MTLPLPEIENESLLAPCGLYCGVCGIYIATRDGNEELRQKLSKFYGTKVVETACRGCMQPEPADCQFPICGACVIRNCVKGKELQSCAQCKKFPCEKISNFPLPVARQFMSEAIPLWRSLCMELGTETGNRAFARSQIERFSCKNCGRSLFRGATWCKACHSPVTPGKVD
ncbi:MAG: hypothetical protein RBG13Loki_3518 [Promethearchaeota archaeon CR_4]|nr:MAG: hypothetical protein RBG13Loki_3518 [Candidatus Lokiarchaeota archaeon CR_4]